MKALPLPVRIAAGLLATAVEQARDLPRTLAELPITAVSQTLQASMRVQQKVTELAIKGDRALAVLQPVQEKPSWATFDDDPEDGGTAVAEEFAGAEEHRGNGVSTLRPRTVTPIDVARETTPPPAAEPEDRIDAVDDLDELDDAEALGLIADAEDDEGGAAPPAARVEGPSALPEYAGLTIPQLRGRLRFLDLPDLRSLLDWELAHDARPPYVTMLQNRIATVTEG